MSSPFQANIEISLFYSKAENRHAVSGLVADHGTADEQAGGPGRFVGRFCQNWEIRRCIPGQQVVDKREASLEAGRQHGGGIGRDIECLGPYYELAALGINPLDLFGDETDPPFGMMRLQLAKPCRRVRG